MGLTAMDTARLAQRAAGRAAAKLVIELANESVSENPDFNDAFWDEVAEWFNAGLPEEDAPAAEAMTDAEAREYGNEGMMFGQVSRTSNRRRAVELAEAQGGARRKRPAP